MSAFASALVLAAVPVTRAGAQPAAASMRPAVSLAAGVTEFDLSGVGSAPIYALRVERPLRSAVLVEGGVALALPAQDVVDGRERRTRLVLPEVGVQLQLPRRVAPYLGLGLGAAFDLRGDAGDTQRDVTVSGAAGARAWLTDRVGLRGEFRVRGIGTGFEGSTADLTLGLAWRL